MSEDARRARGRSPGSIVVRVADLDGHDKESGLAKIPSVYGTATIHRSGAVGDRVWQRLALDLG
jgi:hypothetical protein